ncbi:MAG: hypothetical protein RLZZ292_3283 [Bacteroidota bacterium]|jgi:hypothetical protein
MTYILISFYKMKKIVILLLYCILGATFAQSQQVYNADESASFGDGTGNALIYYLLGRSDFSLAMRLGLVRGEAQISFTVEPDGSISNGKILREVNHAGLSILKTLYAMPKWKPRRIGKEKIAQPDIISSFWISAKTIRKAKRYLRKDASFWK